jgi:predicted secreted hydrolase
LSDVQAQQFRQAARVGRDSLGLSGASPERLQVWLGPWRADPLADDPHGACIAVDAGEFALALTLRAEKPPALHGEHGLDRKGAATGQASWYYSLPRLRTAGTVTADGQAYAVRGTAWMDHEFGTSQLGPQQTGWDWFAVRLADGYDLMLYRLRQRDGGTDPASHGTLIDPQGRATPVRVTPADGVQPRRWWTSPATGGRYPIAWRIDLPAQALALDLTPIFEAQELRPAAGLPFAYWEGAIRVLGTHRGQAVQGEGYLELTGYAGELSESFR